MNIIVLLKQTFDTEEKIVIENQKISENGVEFIVNPYDEYAIEEAIKLRDEHGGEVTAVTVGPQRAESALRTALAMGADKAVLLDDEGLSMDEYSTARVLAAFIKEQSYDIIIGGNMSIDNGSGQVGPRLAELLEIPQVTTITKVEIQNGKAVVERDVEGDLEVIEVALPVLLTAQQGLNDPRYPSLPNIMKAKKKPLQQLTTADLLLDQADIKAKTMTSDLSLPQKKQAGRILAGDIKDQVNELIQLLRNEAKVV